jgi:hypothetical protein
MWYATSHEDRQNMFLIIIAVCAAGRAMMGDAPKQRDDVGLFQYVLLLLTLGGLAAVHLQR